MPRRLNHWETRGCTSRRSDLEYLLSRMGAVEFTYGHGSDSDSGLQFGRMEVLLRDGRTYRFDFPLPDPQSAEFTRNDEGYGQETYAAPETQRVRWQRAVEARWKAFLGYLKEKCLAVQEFGWPEEFLPYIVLPSGQTVAETYGPVVENILAPRRILDPAKPKKGKPRARR